MWFSLEALNKYLNKLQYKKGRSSEQSRHCGYTVDKIVWSCLKTGPRRNSCALNTYQEKVQSISSNDSILNSFITAKLLEFLQQNKRSHCPTHWLYAWTWKLFFAKNPKLVEINLVEEQRKRIANLLPQLQVPAKFHQFVDKCVNNNNYSTILYTHTNIYIWIVFNNYHRTN